MARFVEGWLVISNRQLPLIIIYSQIEQQDLSCVPDINTLVYMAVSLENEKPGIFKKLVPRWSCGEVTIPERDH